MADPTPGLLTSVFLYLRLLYDALVGAACLFVGGLLPKLQVPPKDLTGKTAIITGANSGIGYEIALALAKQGATVYLACRSTFKGQNAADEIVRAVTKASADGSLEKAESRVKVLQLDTSSLASVRSFATKWSEKEGSKQIDILVHNAGISSAPGQQDTTSEGLEMIYATNFLGSFLLTASLEKYLTTKARVILTSSTGQYAGSLSNILYSPRGIWQESVLNRLLGRKTPDSYHYADTKMMQVAFARLLQKRWDRKKAADIPSKIQEPGDVYALQRNKGPIAHAFAPGYVFTPIFDKTPALPVWVDPIFWGLKTLTVLSISAEQGAATGVYLATSDDVEVLMGGGYWDRMAERLSVVDVLNEGMLERVWQCWERDGDVGWE